MSCPYNIIGVGTRLKGGDGSAVSLQHYLGVGTRHCRVPTILFGSRDTAQRRRRQCRVPTILFGSRDTALPCPKLLNMTEGYLINRPLGMSH